MNSDKQCSTVLLSPKSNACREKEKKKKKLKRRTENMGFSQIQTQPKRFVFGLL